MKKLLCLAIGCLMAGSVVAMQEQQKIQAPDKFLKELKSYEEDLSSFSKPSLHDWSIQKDDQSQILTVILYHEGGRSIIYPFDRLKIGKKNTRGLSTFIAHAFDKLVYLLNDEDADAMVKRLNTLRDQMEYVEKLYAEIENNK